MPLHQQTQACDIHHHPDPIWGNGLSPREGVPPTPQQLDDIAWWIESSGVLSNNTLREVLKARMQNAIKWATDKKHFDAHRAGARAVEKLLTELKAIYEHRSDLTAMRGILLAAENDIIERLRWSLAREKNWDPKGEEAHQVHVTLESGTPSQVIGKLELRLHEAVLDLRCGGTGLRVRRASPGSDNLVQPRRLQAGEGPWLSRVVARAGGPASG